MSDLQIQKNMDVSVLKEKIPLTLQATSIIFDEVIYKEYLTELSILKIIPDTGRGEFIRWYMITKSVYEK